MSAQQTAGLGYHCLAWGESDHAVSCFVDTVEGVAEFFRYEWFGEGPETMHPSVREEFDAAMARAKSGRDDQTAWDGSDVIDWTFEIGGIRITRAFRSPADPYAALQAQVDCLRAELAEALDACRYVRTNIGSIPPHKILARVERPLSMATTGAALASLGSAK